MNVPVYNKKCSKFLNKNENVNILPIGIAVSYPHPQEK